MPDSIATQSVLIRATPAQVWRALTDPEMIRLYLFGTECSSDWKVGSPVTYTGVWEGAAYEDKGVVVEVVPERKLASTYWSGMSGLADAPENYKLVTYDLAPVDGGTRVTVTQDKNPTDESRAHSEANWKMVLEGLKKLLEE